MASIVVLRGTQTGAEYKLEDRTVIGREPPAGGIVLEDKLASRQHAEIVRREGKYVIRDLNSLNGTHVDGFPIKEYVLTDGAKIRIGSHHLVFRDEVQMAESEHLSSLFVIEDVEAEPSPRKESSKIEIDATAAKLMDSSQFQDLAASRRAYDQLQVLFKASKALTSTKSMEEVLDEVIRTLMDAFPTADRCFIVLVDEDSGQLVPSAGRNRDGESLSELVLSRTILSKILNERRAILTQDIGNQQEFRDALSIAELSIRSFMCAPLLYREKVLGILEVDSRRVLPRFTEDDLNLLNSLAIQAALAIQNARDLHERQLLYLGNIGTLVRAVEARDEYTRGHSIRVAEYATLIAKRFNASCDPQQRINVERLRYAGQLHDAGKINVSQSILHKPSQLTFEEYEQLKRHPIVTHYILSEMHLPPELKGMDIIAALHHERYDGTGYPCGFKGEEIPLESRILATADAFDAMTSDRPYRKAMDPEVAIEKLKATSGTQLDPTCITILCDLHKEGTLVPIIGSHRVGELATLPTEAKFRSLIAKLQESLFSNPKPIDPKASRIRLSRPV